MIKSTLISLLATSIACSVIGKREFGINTIASPKVNQMQSAQRSAGLFPFFNRRGLKLSEVNSPTINQQQNIEADEYESWGDEDGFGDDGNGSFGFNSFNNVGGIDKTNAIPFAGSGFGLGSALGGIFSRRSLDLSYMASPTVYMMQDISATPEYGQAVDEDGDPYWGGFGHLNSMGAMGGGFMN